MSKFKIGDKVRVRPDVNSQFRGRVGIVEKEPNKNANLFGYTVKIELSGFKPTCQFVEQDLEAVSNK